VNAEDSGLVLAADVGGTKTALALAPAHANALPSHRQTLPSAGHAAFEPLLDAFLASAGRPRVTAAAIAAAGPVANGVVRITHLPWQIEAARVAAALGGARVTLLNDAVATAQGMLELPPESFAQLQGARLREPGTLAVLAVGTGLGETLLLDGGSGRVRALPSEGGHAAFAPRTARERALLAQLAGPEDAHVAVEDVVSGPGLARVHGFCRGDARGPLLDPAAISEAALRGDDPVAVDALALFLGCLGSHAGDLLLRAVADGGLWLGGGIPPRLLAPLRRGPFLAALRAKGRLGDWLAARPVAVCLSPDAALFGALREARALANVPR
jgi:glucokinase